MPSNSVITGSATIWSQKTGVVYTYNYLTSTIYPLEQFETLDSAPSVSSIRVYTFDIPVVELGPTILGVDLKAILVEHSQPQEDVTEFAPSAVGVTLQVILVEHVQPPEDVVEFAPGVAAATLALIVIAHVQPPEDILKFQPSILGVVLGAP